jgi:hypothetical protein
MVAPPPPGGGAIGVCSVTAWCRGDINASHAPAGARIEVKRNGDR